MTNTKPLQSLIATSLFISSTLCIAHDDFSIFVIPVTGKPTGDANAMEVLAGKTFSSASGVGLSGTMPNNGAVNLTPEATPQTIPVGYHNGSGILSGDANLTASNIKNGIRIFGTSGTVIQATGTATAVEVLTGRTFSNNTSASLSGTMPDNGAISIIPGTAPQTIPAGYHNGAGGVAGDGNLTAANIRSGVSVFGVTGSPDVVDTGSGNATPEDIVSGKTAWAGGQQITGTLNVQTCQGNLNGT
ncbi:MAG: hypothetical protein GY703_01190 [Gammaproteobacteria bacterium]|nr:hypothetical protein [Gammaproteobacteria bacterium]